MQTIEEHKKEKLEFQRKEMIDKINNCNDVTRKNELLEEVRNSNDPILIREVLTEVTLSDSGKETLLKVFCSKTNSAYFTQQLIYLYTKDSESLISSFGSINKFRDYISSDKYLDTDNIPQEFLDALNSIAKKESDNMMILTRTKIKQGLLPYASDDKLPVTNIPYDPTKTYRSK